MDLFAGEVSEIEGGRCHGANGRHGSDGASHAASQQHHVLRQQTRTRVCIQ